MTIFEMLLYALGYFLIGYLYSQVIGGSHGQVGQNNR